MKKLIVLLILVMAVSVNAATLKWDAVPDTSDCTVLGYIVEAEPTAGGDLKNYDVGNNAELVDFQTILNLLPSTEYTFSVYAYAAGGRGLSSEPITWTYILPPWTVPENTVGDTVIIIPGKVNTLIIQNGE